MTSALARVSLRFIQSCSMLPLMKAFCHLAPALLLAFIVDLGAATPLKNTQKVTAPDQVPEGLAKSDWASIRAAYEAGRHSFQPNDGGWQAGNPRQQWLTTFDGRGFMAEPKGGDWQWGLELRSYGFSDNEHPTSGQPAVKAEGQRLTYQWDKVVQEWFVNDERGLEHGFTVKERPEGAPDTPLQFHLAVRGSLFPQITLDALGVHFLDSQGTTVLHYSGLKVWDAHGKILPSHFEAHGQKGVRLLVDERGARYPLTIDPIAQQATITGSNTESGDSYGLSVAVSGDTVVIGAPLEDSGSAGVNSTPNEGAIDSGAVYVFIRSGATWTQQAYLKASNPGADDRFGYSVAVSGNSVVVGAYNEDSNTTGVNSTPNNLATDSGAVYVFIRSGTTWTQQAYLKAFNPEVSDYFGWSVAVSGDTVVVGATLEDSSSTGVNSTPNESRTSAGAAYVFTRSGNTWTQQAYLKASNPGTSDNFGNSVGVSGDTVVVGAWQEDSSTTGVNSSPNDVGINFNSGAAYVFTRSGTTWTQQAYLKPAVGGLSQDNDQFGISVGVSGETVVVGAWKEDSSTTGVNSSPNDFAAESGAAYIFSRSETSWSQQAYLKASNTAAGGGFGSTVGISGETVAVFGSGAFYAFMRNGTIWTQQDTLNTGGVSVAISGDTVVSGNSSAAYIFVGAGTAPAPEIVVEQPADTIITDGGTKSFGGILPGGTSDLTFALKNLGDADLVLSGSPKVVVNGTHAAMFTVTAQPTSPVTGPSGSATFTVRFAPTSSGLKSAALAIPNNDADEGPYDINLTGSGLAFTDDTDGDGLNDASEFQMAALGYNWQVNQTALVNTLFSNLNGVLPNLNASGFFTTAQVQALNVGTPLIQRNPTTGEFTLTVGVEKSPNLSSFTPFPMTLPQTTINAQGKLEFQFTVPDNAAFFRLQAQ